MHFVPPDRLQWRYLAVPHTGSTTCEQCHDTVLWTDAKFDHSTTGSRWWARTWIHRASARTATRTTTINITVTTCISCHQTDFNGATTPVPHTGFPTTCEQCHDTVLWTDAKFDHSTTGFPLVARTWIRASLRGLPQEQQLQHHGDDLYFVPPDGLQRRNHASGCRTRAFPIDMLRTMPRHGAVDGRKFDHSTTGFPLVGAHMDPPPSLRGLPQEQQLQHHCDDVCVMPTNGLQHRQDARRSHCLPDDVRRLP